MFFVNPAPKTQPRNKNTTKNNNRNTNTKIFFARTINPKQKTKTDNIYITKITKITKNTKYKRRKEEKKEYNLFSYI